MQAMPVSKHPYQTPKKGKQKKDREERGAVAAAALFGMFCYCPIVLLHHLPCH